MCVCVCVCWRNRKGKEKQVLKREKINERRKNIERQRERK